MTKRTRLIGLATCCAALAGLFVLHGAHPIKTLASALILWSITAFVVLEDNGDPIL